MSADTDPGQTRVPAAGPALDPVVAPALDPAVVAELQRSQREFGNPGFIAQLVALFRANAPARMAAIREAVTAHDGGSLGHTAHTLKSNCAMLGAKRMAGICERLEACGDSGSFDEAAACSEGKALLGDAERELARVLAELALLAACQKSEVRSQKSE